MKKDIFQTKVRHIFYSYIDNIILIHELFLSEQKANEQDLYFV